MAWALEHDEKVFPDSEVVKPERYLKEDGTLDPKTPIYTFGSVIHSSRTLAWTYPFDRVGRRLCPGSHLATSSLAMAAATLAWAFHFNHATDDQGKSIKPDSRPENCVAGGSV